MRLYLHISTFIVVASGFATHASMAYAFETPEFPGWYAAIHAGTNHYSDDNTLTYGMTTETVEADMGYILGASAGYKPQTGTWFDMFRAEAEYSFRGQSLSAVGSTPRGGDLLSHTFMANVIADFSNPTIFTPYTGVGYGFTEFDFDGDDETVTAWQFLAGVDLTPSDEEQVVWGVRYRYLDSDAGPITYNGALANMTYETHSIEATTRLHF